VRERPTVTGGAAAAERTATVVRGTSTPSGASRYKDRIAVSVMCATPTGWRRSPSFRARIGGRSGMTID
jgi:hypothetical protein